MPVSCVSFVGLRILEAAQTCPSHVSAKPDRPEVPPRLPRAIQNVLEAHEIPVKVDPGGAGAFSISQTVPIQSSVSVASAPAAFTRLPTAMHESAVSQETPLNDPVGNLGAAGSTDQALFEGDAGFATGGVACAAGGTSSAVTPARTMTTRPRRSLFTHPPRPPRAGRYHLRVGESSRPRA